METETIQSQPFESIGLKDIHHRFDYWTMGVLPTLVCDYFIQGDLDIFEPHYTDSYFANYQLSDFAFVPFTYPLTYLCLKTGIKLTRAIANNQQLFEQLDNNLKMHLVTVTAGFLGVVGLYELPQILLHGNPQRGIEDIAAYALGAAALMCRPFYQEVYLPHKQNLIDSIEVAREVKSDEGILSGLKAGLEHSLQDQKHDWKNGLTRMLISALR